MFSAELSLAAIQVGHAKLVFQPQTLLVIRRNTPNAENWLML